MNTPTLAPKVANASRRLYRGTTVMRFLLSSEDTNGAIAIIEFHAIKGTEPPRHVHDREDEIFMLKEGEMTFFIGDNMIKAYPGDVIFAPRGIAHSFKIDTYWAKFNTIITPGAFDRFFWKQSTPYSAGDPVPTMGAPVNSSIELLVQQSTEFGVRFV